jgi:hypothetical protein
MMAFLVKLLVLVSWAVLLIASFAALAGGWLYYGSINMDCHPIFATEQATCGIAAALASEHTLIGVRSLLPYRQTLTDQLDVLILVAAGAVGAAFMILIVYRTVRRRRRRHLGIFADVPGFRPIERMEDR